MQKKGHLQLQNRKPQLVTLHFGSQPKSQVHFGDMTLSFRMFSHRNPGWRSKSSHRDTEGGGVGFVAPAHYFSLGSDNQAKIGKEEVRNLGKSSRLLSGKICILAPKSGH